MENYSYSSYADSGDSSPRSREIDCENSSWDDPPTTYKVKFMCSYGGKIHPRPHDNQLAYIGGDTKILAVDRHIKFATFMAKLSSLCDSEICFKYQLPGEDLDALISVTNDEDLDHMMLEYDRLYRASPKPPRMRLFLFPVNTPDATAGFVSGELKSERQWFVDALNSVQIQNLEGSSPPAVAAGNPDFLFGLDKGFPAAKLHDQPPLPTVPDVSPKAITAWSEDRHLVGGPVDMQRQIQELQRLQIASQEQALSHIKSEEGNPRAYPGDYYAQKIPENPGDYYAQKIPEKVAPPPVQMPIPATYLPPDRHMTSGGYPVAAAGAEPPVYLIPTPAGVYQTSTFRPVTGPAGQAYYGVQRVVSEPYREQPVYSGVPAATIQQAKIGAYSEGIGMMQPKVGVAEPGYAQVGYDSAGRQVYYTAAPGGVVQPYPAVVSPAGDGRQGGGALNQEGKVVAKVSQASV